MLDIFGELNQDFKADWERHLKSCPDCRAEKNATTRALEITKTVLEAPVLEEYEAAAMRNRVIRELTSAPKSLRGRKRPFFFSRAFIPVLTSACVLLIVLGFMASKFLTGPEINTGTQLAITQEHLPVIDTGTRLASYQEHLQAEDIDIINNMDLLRNLDALDKLSKVIDQSQPSSRPNNVQGKNGYGKKSIFS